MKKLLKTHNFNSDMDYFQMICDSFNNGQINQAIEQFKALPRKERKRMVKHLFGNWAADLHITQKHLLIDNI